ncbi:MAG: putative peptide zinc metalloprotease protein [Actinomycetota bacterium]|jgi:putative peptide zinc metalloprotease protein|nr:putative peptide zinc metalloprotease protein [Actinomycetota bacterium]
MVLAHESRRAADGGVTLPPEQSAWTVPAGHAARYQRRRAASPATSRGEQIRLAADVELLGSSEGSGYVDEHHLARTAAGRIVQLTDLLFLIAQAAGPQGMSDEQVAQQVSGEYGKTVSADNVRKLAGKLRTLGVLAEADGSEPDVPDADPLLALKLRSTLLGPTGVRRLTLPLRPLFFLPIVLATLVGLIAMDAWLFLAHGLAQGMRQAMERPALFLLAFGLVVISAAFHECGHATACTVGGGKPGRMGAGIYLAWPAFYTDVTDAYRLDRRARLRTDLGGVYFSCLLVLGLGAVYAATGFEPLLLIAFLMQIEVVHQMLPFLRLDGYYVVSDLVGVPDLFRRTGPVLRSMLPGSKPEPSVLELKRWVRNVVRLWVLIVVPILLVNVGMILLNFPRMLSTAWNSAAKLIHGITTSGGVTVAIDGIQLVFLAIPIIGLGYTFGRLFSQLGRKGWTASAGSPAKRTGFLLAAAAVLGVLVFAWWPDARYTPYREGETGTLQTQAAALQYVGQGQPVLRSPSDAVKPLPPLPSKLSGAFAPGTTTPATTGTTTVTTEPSPAASPDGGVDATASAAPAPADSAAPDASPSPTDAPSPDVSPSP